MQTSASTPIMGSANPASAADSPMVDRRRQSVHARKVRERRKNIYYTVTSLAMVVLILTLGLYSGVIPKLLESSPSKSKQAVDTFATTRVGTVRTPYQGNTCQELHFDNKGGKFVGKRLTSCEDTNIVPNENSTVGRFRAIRNAFSR